MVKKFLGIDGSKNAKLVITKSMMIYGLVVILTLFTCYRVYANSVLARELVSSRTDLLMSQIKSPNSSDELNKAFSGGMFCGWKLIGADGQNMSSQDFDQTSEGEHLFVKEFNDGGIERVFTLCLATFNSIDSSTNRQLGFTVFLAGLIILLVYTARIDQKDEEDKKAIPDA